MFITLSYVLRHKALYGMGDGNAREGSCMLSSFYFPLIAVVVLCLLCLIKLFTPVIFCFSSAFGCGLFIYFVVGFCSVPAQTVQWHSLGKGAIVLESQVFR